MGYINRLRDNHHMIISIEIKHLTKSTTFMIKTLNKLGTEEYFFMLMKGTYQKMKVKLYQMVKD